MANIQSVFLGKVVKIEDPNSWTIRVNIIGQPDFEKDKEPLALPWGSTTTQVEVDDNVILFQVSDRITNLFYMLIKTNSEGRVGIFCQKSFIDITDPDTVVIKANDKCYTIVNGDLYTKVDGDVQIDYNGSVSVNVYKDITYKGTGKIKMNGVAVQDGVGYFWNSVPKCPMNGNDHGCNAIQIFTPPDTPIQEPETKPNIKE